MEHSSCPFANDRGSASVRGPEVFFNGARGVIHSAEGRGANEIRATSTCLDKVCVPLDISPYARSRCRGMGKSGICFLPPKTFHKPMAAAKGAMLFQSLQSEILAGKPCRSHAAPTRSCAQIGFLCLDGCLHPHPARSRCAGRRVRAPRLTSDGGALLNLAHTICAHT